MKYRLTFKCDGEVALPTQSNKILQAAILSWLGDNGYARFLHDQGYQRENRCFKLYTFSEIESPYYYDREQRRCIYSDTVQFYVSFYTEESDSLILQNIVQRKSLRLGNSTLEFHDCELVREMYTDCVVRTASPVTIHSTMELPDGRKKTYYYSPGERDFSEMLRQNLIRKYKAYHGHVPEDDTFTVTRHGSPKAQEVIVHYNRFVIKGWQGSFRLCGSKEMIRMALLSGLGARNGIGMGCMVQTEILSI